MHMQGQIRLKYLKKNAIVQLEASKLSIKDLFSNLINDIKGFKYQITVKVLLKKYKPNGEIEFAPVYFNSLTKLIINYRYKLNKSFQEILFRIDAWINEGLLNRLSHNILILRLLSH